MNPLANAGYYLTDTIFNFFIYLVLIRFWMQWVHANFHNQIGQTIINLSNPIIIPFRKVLPSIGTVDTASLVVAFIITYLKLITFSLLKGFSPDWLTFVTHALGSLINSCTYIFMGAIFLKIIMSWVNPHSYHPVMGIAHAIAEPLMAPARKLLPAFSGLDLSPILVIMFLKLTQILIAIPLMNLRLSF